MKKIYIVVEESTINNDFQSSIRVAFENRDDAVQFIGSEIKDCINNYDWRETDNYNYQYAVEDDDNNYIGWYIEETEYYEIHSS